MKQRNSGIYLLLIYLAFAVYLLPLFSDLDGSNGDLARWAMTASLVEKNSLDISWADKIFDADLSAIVMREGNAAYYKGSPGIAFLSAPFYAIARVFLGAPNPDNAKISWLFLRLIIGALPLVLLATWLIKKHVDVFSLGVLLFATPLFPVSLTYSSGVLAAILVYYAFRMLFDNRRVFPEKCLYSGFICGLAFFCEFAVVIPLVVFGAGLIFTESRDSRRRVLYYIAGATPFVMALAVYYQVVFGSPLAIFSSFKISSPLFNLYELLISPSGGLFFLSPILLLSLLTFIDSEESGFRRHRVKILTIFLSFIFAIFVSIDSNAFLAAPQLIIVLPLLLDAFFDGETEDYPCVIRGALFAGSLLLCAVPVLTYQFAPDTLQYPHNSFWQPLIYDANIYAPTVITVFAPVNNIWTILPVMALLFAAIVIVWRDAKYPVRFATGILAGFLFVGNYMFALNLESEKARPYLEKVQVVRTKNL